MQQTSERKYSPVHLLSGLLLMLSASYLDNVRGVILPVITKQLKVNYSDGSWFLVLGNWAALVFTLSLLPLIKRYHDRKLAFGLALFAIAVLFSGILVADFPRLLLFAFVLGGVLASMGTLSNLLTMNGTTPLILSRTLSGMHVMYGVGSLLAPIVTAPMLAKNIAWQWVLWVPIPLLLGVVWLNFSAKTSVFGNDAATQQTTVKFKMSKLQLLLLAAFGAYVCGEVLVSMWMTTYLIEFRGLTIDGAAPYLIGFFAVMALTRFVCFLLASESYVKPLIYFSLTVPVVMFVLGLAGYNWAFCAVGLIGPFFPLFMARITRTFPDAWQQLTIFVVVTMQLGLGLAHLVLGKLVDLLGAQKAYMVPIVFLVFTLIIILIYFKREKLLMTTRSPVGVG